MKSHALQQRVAGAFVGLAAGDAMARAVGRLAPDEAKRRAAVESGPAPHGALTTWTLAVLDALLYRGDAAGRAGGGLAPQLSLALRVLVLPCRGAALRGHLRSLAGALAQAARALERDDDVRTAGVDDASAEGMAAVLPLAFALGDDDDDVAAAAVDVVTLTHRHVRCATGAGLWLGGLRALLRKERPGLVEVVDEGMVFARRALGAYRERRHGVVVGALSEAEGAIAMAASLARHLEDPCSILPPEGYDGRDDPERYAVAALAAAVAPVDVLLAAVASRVACGGDADVAVPLMTASAGLARGEEHLPLSLVERAATRDMVRRRALALFDERPPRLAPLVFEELAVMACAPSSAPVARSRVARAREQLKLL